MTIELKSDCPFIFRSLSVGGGEQNKILPAARGCFYQETAGLNTLTLDPNAGDFILPPQFWLIS